MCIEAALIGHNIAPGFNRDFACEAWDWFDSSVFEKVRAAADNAADYDIELDIAGSDINGRMIEIARANAEEIGLGIRSNLSNRLSKTLRPKKTTV